MRFTRLLLWGVVAAVVGFALIQLVPYRITNPSTKIDEPRWNSPQTRALAVRACYDCHSNETKTPWYGKVAPVSWWLTNHVDEGRAAVNFSTWHTNPGSRASRSAHATEESMPPSYYHWFGLHSSGNLTPTERQQLVDGLRATIAKDPPPHQSKGGGEGGGGDDGG